MRTRPGMEPPRLQDAECIPQVTVIEPPEAEYPEEELEGERHVVKDMAMVALALLKQEVKVMLQQVKHLVKANPQLALQVFTCDVDGWTPVHACALRGKKKVLKAMLHCGIDVNARMGQPEGLPAGCTLLHIAANRDDKKVADYLLHHGAIINATDSFGRTPLFYATRSGCKDVIKLLTDYGACLNAENDVRASPARHKLASRLLHERVASDSERGTSSATEDDSDRRNGASARGGKSREGEREGRGSGEDRGGPSTPEPRASRLCFLPVPPPQHRHHNNLQAQLGHRRPSPRHPASEQQLPQHQHHHRQHQQQHQDGLHQTLRHQGLERCRPNIPRLRLRSGHVSS